MVRLLGSLALAILWAMPSAAEPRTVTHTGVVVGVEADQRGMSVEEMGPWTGPKRGLVTRKVVVTPETRVWIVTRSQQAGGTGWPGAFTETAATRADIAPGHFVTVVTELHDAKLVAREVRVLRPAPESDRP